MEGVAGRGRALAFAVLGVAAACGVTEGVVARVGSQDVEVQMLQDYLGGVTGMDWHLLEERVASRLLDQFLDQEVVAAAMAGRRDLKIPVEPAARSAVVRSLLGELCGAAPGAPEADVEREIARRLEQVRPARAHVRQLLLDTLDEAEAARRRIQAGEGFVEVSSEVSRAPNADAGGELGFVVQGTLPEDIDEVIFGLAEGEISRPVASPAGYHVFQVMEIVAQGPAGRSEVEVAVRRELGESAAREFTRACIERHAAEVGVSVFPEHLWFRYSGRYGGSDEG